MYATKEKIASAHAQSVPEIVRNFTADPLTGLTARAVESARSRWGWNELAR